MSAPFIWIILPILTSGLLYGFKRWEKWTRLAALLIAIILAFLAFRLPIGVVISLRLWSGFPPFTIRESIPLLGARLAVVETIKPMVAFLYFSLAVWFAGGIALNAKPIFYSLGLAVLGVLTAALSITPLTYAPFFLEIAAIICIPLISPPGKRTSRSVTRFLTFQTLGMLLILLGIWLTLNISIQQDMINLPLGPLVILGLGFALIIGIPPFHSWILMILEENPIYESGLISFIFPAAGMLILIKTMALANLSPFSSTSSFIEIIQTIALFTILFGGIWCAYATQAGRGLGYSIIQKTGYFLLIISMIEFSPTAPSDTTLFSINMLIIGMTIWIYALSMNVFFVSTADLRFSALQGFAYRLPVASIGALISIFSFAGIPFLAFFPVYSLIFPQLIQQTTSPMIIGVFSNTLLAIFGIRLMYALIDSPAERTWHLTERRIQILLIVGGSLMIIIIGIFPNIYIPYLDRWITAFSGTSP